MDAAPDGQQLTGYQSQNGGFAYTTGAHYGHDTATPDIHADIIEYDFLTSLVMHISELNDRIFQAFVPVACLGCGAV
jgi:hypothetical protein